MLVIDGSAHEGGGQIVRATVALSALTGIPVRLKRVREGRERPGLMPQHVAAVRAVAASCNAEVTGCITGSRDLAFDPGPLSRTEIVLDIGTAGSIPLVLQAWLPPAVKAGGTITLAGGTDVGRSPTVDYLSRVLVPLLVLHGASLSLEVLKHGYYPKGGGLVRVDANPSALRPLSPAAFPNHDGRGICSCSSGLPAHVAERQAKAAAALLSNHTALHFPVITDARPGPGTGSSCTAWAGWKGGIGIGRRGYPSERVGEDAARALIAEIDGGGAVDSHLADQLLVYLAMAGGAYTAPALTLHARTVCGLLEQFGFAIKVREEGVAVFALAPGA